MRRQCFQFGLFLCFLLCSHSVQAATFNCNDVACLINSIAASNSNGEANTIMLWPTTYSLTAINHEAANHQGFYGLPAITGTMSIRGVDSGKTLLSSLTVGLFEVSATGNLTLDRVSLVANSALAGSVVNSKNGNVSLVRSRLPQSGGGFYKLVNDGGTLIIDNTIISEISADPCVVLTKGGVVRISDSVFTHNTGFHDCGVMDIAGGSVFITRSTFSDNIADGAGAILAREGSFTIITDSAFTANRGFSLPIFSLGVMFVTNATIARNALTFRPIFPIGPGTGIGNQGSLLINNSTIVDNSLDDPRLTQAGAVWGNTNTLIQNSVVARNKLGNCLGPVRSLGNNVFDDMSCSALPTDLIGDPGLGPFRDDGSPGKGHYPLQFFSRAINAGNNSACPADDQLGRKRLGQCDIGAVAGFGFGPVF